MKLKMCTTVDIFCLICLKAVRDTFFQFLHWNQGKDRARREERGNNSVLVRSDIQQKGEVQNFGHELVELSQAPPLVANPDHPVKNALESFLGLITEIILKKVREIFFFQSNKCTACKVRDGKEDAKSLRVFNLREILHHFKLRNI